MYLNKIHFTAVDIWSQKFSKALKGYHCNEVDEYLDLIIKDYQSIEKHMEDLMEENIKLRRHITEINKQNVDKSNKIDILQRLSKLEKHVFFEKLTSS
ncbi:DivIVA domain-containing protein [Bacillus sp. V2I10]|uniref:DivIVA domain-containing protein n=1 Tax=Bacillus sp. V2I10 TaxID=3042276 RepID=UPI002782BA0C|nr:DivIVA domain-containing protein [Bacillus sp. V2I10]MDQ0859087.1 DivIVA domain-containing protein [Bacillus sp. V2I10]